MSQPDPAEVLAWMDTHGRGYKAAAKEFGVTREQVKAWRQGATAAGGGQGRAVSSRPPPKPPADEGPAPVVMTAFASEGENAAELLKRTTSAWRPGWRTSRRSSSCTRSRRSQRRRAGSR